MKNTAEFVGFSAPEKDPLLEKFNRWLSEYGSDGGEDLSPFDCE